MGKSLQEIAQELVNAKKKVQLIYAFNGTGKTRLSREFKELVAPKSDDAEDEKIKVMYYNAFTEDLFYWDNDLQYDSDRKLKIQPNNYTHWILNNQGKEDDIKEIFQRYTTDRITPKYNEEYITKDKDGRDLTIPAYSEVYFSYAGDYDETPANIKISKGGESCFIWSVFYSLLKTTILTLNEDISNRDTEDFNKLEYVFIDDPVSSLDDNHLIELAVNISELIKKSHELKFIISTHNPLFLNVLMNEISNKHCYLLQKLEDGTFDLKPKQGDSNKSFSYHLHLIKIIEDAIANKSIEKFHFTLLRNLYEKTANFLGYPKWSELLPDDKQTYYNRVMQFASHSTLSNEVIPEPTDVEKNIVDFLLQHLKDNHYWKEQVAINP